jgi:WD40 repeat protein
VIALFLAVAAAASETTEEAWPAHKEVWALASSADGKLLASAGSTPNSPVVIWDARTRARLRSIDVNGRATALAFSSRGLLAAGVDNGVALLNPTTGEVLKELGEGDWNDVEAVAFSADGSVLAAVEKYKLHVWRVQDGQALQSVRLDSHAYDVSLSPDGTRVAVATGARKVLLYRVGNNVPENTLEAWDEVHCVAFTPDGASVFYGGWQEIRLHDVRKDRLRWKVMMPEGTSPDCQRALLLDGGAQVAFLSPYGEAAVHRLSDGKRTGYHRKMVEIGSDHVGLAVLPGKLLVEGHGQDVIGVWRLPSLADVKPR